MIKLYNSYKDDGIEFIGIADDDKRVEEWKTAIKKDGIGIWKHVLRGRSVNNKQNSTDINELYSIESMPTMLLIDMDGKIIGRYSESNEDEENLRNKLKELFEKK